ncbi:TPA: hypothetical protein EYO12_01560 [Candidatus Saccharibacteria bacterium]|nr:hypothetical protein [Candidatus Saccharibacteria bacterium]HIO87403.1 hypothetical protein [Candidatus Saccharibacteria bacterium]
MSIEAQPNIQRDYLAGYRLPTEGEIVQPVIEELENSWLVGETIESSTHHDQPIYVSESPYGMIHPVEQGNKANHLGSVTVVRARIANSADSVDEEVLQTTESNRIARVLADTLQGVKLSIKAHLIEHGRTARTANSIADEVVPRIDDHALRSATGYLYDLDGNIRNVSHLSALIFSERVYHFEGEDKLTLDKSRDSLTLQTTRREKAAVFIVEIRTE